MGDIYIRMDIFNAVTIDVNSNFNENLYWTHFFKQHTTQVTHMDFSTIYDTALSQANEYSAWVQNEYYQNKDFGHAAFVFGCIAAATSLIVINNILRCRSVKHIQSDEMKELRTLAKNILGDGVVETNKAPSACCTKKKIANVVFWLGIFGAIGIVYHVGKSHGCMSASVAKGEDDIISNLNNVVNFLWNGKTGSEDDILTNIGSPKTGL